MYVCSPTKISILPTELIRGLNYTRFNFFVLYKATKKPAKLLVDGCVK